ncbi:phospholipase A2, membrane associated-like [Liasis olivaceus]
MPVRLSVKPCGDCDSPNSLGQTSDFRRAALSSGLSQNALDSPRGCSLRSTGRQRPKETRGGHPLCLLPRCCRAHDCCYHRLEARGCRPRTTTYSYSYAWGDVRCGSNRNWCEQEICSCDQALARCLKSSKGGYQWKYTFYPNVLCRGSAPAC